MFQLEYLNKQKMSLLEKFLEQFEEFLNSIDHNLSIGIEIRNSNYLNFKFLPFCRKISLLMCYFKDIICLQLLKFTRKNLINA